MGVEKPFGNVHVTINNSVFVCIFISCYFLSSCFVYKNKKCLKQPPKHGSKNTLVKKLAISKTVRKNIKNHNNHKANRNTRRSGLSNSAVLHVFDCSSDVDIADDE